MTVLCESLVASCLCVIAFAASGSKDPPLPADLLTSVHDRADLKSDASQLAKALDEVTQILPSDLQASAKRHAETRRETLQASAGRSQADVPVFEDLMRFPEVNRGHAVSLTGDLRTSRVVTLDGTECRLLIGSPAEDASRAVAMLVPATAEPPTNVKGVRFVGVFAKLVELPAEGNATPVIAPLLLAPAAPREPHIGDAPDPAQWSVVSHRTLGVRAGEKDLYYKVLGWTAAEEPAKLKAAAHDFLAERKRAAPKRLRKQTPFPTFVDVFKHAEAYEGRPVTLKGYAREIRKYPAGDNTEGIETLYEAWVYTDDSESNPAVIVASSAPADLPIGSDLQVPVEVTGYFFKIYAYHAHDTARVAPMILAGRIEPLPEPTLSGPPKWFLISVVALVALLFAWFLVSYFGIRRKRIMNDTAGSPDFTGIQNEGEA